jgi:hypothetical protein
MLKKEIRAPILALFLLSLGGLLIHIRIHPVVEMPWRSAPASAFNLAAVIPGVLTALLVPPLLNYRRTVAWGYMLNWATVLIGTVTMAYYSLVKDPPDNFTLQWVLLQSTLADILILWAKVPLGHAVLRYFRPKGGKGGAS